MSNRTFNIIRALVEIGLPAVGTFYIVIAGIWGLPFGDEINKTILAIVTCLGAFITIARKAYENDYGEDD